MNASAKICVVRHGETNWNIAGILQGWMDVAINDKGREQAFELAFAFKDCGFSAICSSPLIRSLETARIIARELRLPEPECHDGLKERNFGAIQGIPKAELAELNPALLQQIQRRNPAAHFEQGESLDEFAHRVLGAVTAIAFRHPEQRVLVVTHGWVMDVITRHVNHLPREAILNMKRKNGEFLWLEATRKAIHLLAAEAHPVAFECAPFRQH